MVQTCYSTNFRRTRCYYTSPWDAYVRWIVLVVIVLAFFLLFVLCSCLTARRRRRAGRSPFYGTGWAAGRFPYMNNYNKNNTTTNTDPNAAPYYNQNYSQPAPPYSPPQGPTTSFYGTGAQAQQPQGQQQMGIELQNHDAPQPPSNTYKPAGITPYGDEYAPPPGPPPAKY